MRTRCSRVLVLLVYSVANLAAQDSHPAQVTAPEVLSFEELSRLSQIPEPRGTLGERINKLLDTPFIRTVASTTDSQPRRPVVEGLGPVLRV